MAGEITNRVSRRAFILGAILVLVILAACARMYWHWNSKHDSEPATTAAAAVAPVAESMTATSPNVRVTIGATSGGTITPVVPVHEPASESAFVTPIVSRTPAVEAEIVSNVNLGPTRAVLSVYYMDLLNFFAEFENGGVVLSEGADLNGERSRHGRSVLFEAVMQEKAGLVDFLLRQGADRSFWDPETNLSMLHVAAGKASTPIVEMLLNAGMDVDLRATDEKFTPLHRVASGYIHGERAVETARLLLSRGARVDAVTRKSRDTALSFAIENSQSELVRVLLQDYHADPNGHVSKTRAPVLQLAMRLCVPDIVNALLDHKANPLQENSMLLAPVHYAASHGCTFAMEQFLDMGVPVDYRVPLIVPLGFDRADVRLSSLGSTLLQFAACGKHKGVINLLLDRGADVSIPNRKKVFPQAHIKEKEDPELYARLQPDARGEEYIAQDLAEIGDDGYSFTNLLESYGWKW